MPDDKSVVFASDRVLGSYVVNSFNRSFDISPDGQRFLMMKDARSTDDDPYAGLAQMIVVQNWFQQLTPGFRWSDDLTMNITHILC